MRLVFARGAYKTKRFWEGKEDRKLWRYVLVDDCSGCLVFRYVQQQDETLSSLWDFLVYAWGAKTDPRHVFSGAPHVLWWDKVSASLVDERFGGELDRCGIQHRVPVRERGESLSSGTAGHRSVARQFESLLPYRPAASVADLNQRAERWAMGVQRERDTRRRQLASTEG